MGNFCNHYKMALKKLLGSDIFITEINLLTTEENDFINKQSQGSIRTYTEKTLPEQLLASFQEHSEQLAVINDAKTINYKILGEMAKNVASSLQGRGVKQGDYVVVQLPRTIERVVILCGILISGAAYIPIEINTTRERTRGVLVDSEPVLLISETEDMGFDIVTLKPGDVLNTSPTRFQPVRYKLSDPTYIIYTSDSTGKPKGVLVGEAGIVNRLAWMQESYRLTSLDRVMQKTPYSFDVSVWEFFWPLLNGASLVVPKEDGHKDPEYLVEQINKHQVTTMHFVPSMLSVFLNVIDIASCQGLRQIICSGEALSRKDVNRVLSNSNIKLHNLYGPTEASIGVTCHECCYEEATMPVAIGKPIANMRTYILDKDLQLVAVGVPGELYLSGVGLARGYINRTELTAEKFIQNPFSKDSTYERLYKTGDLVKQGVNGEMYYLGRLDHQIKLRGLRIELGEIEQSILTYPQVSNSIVLIRKINNSNHLVAYYSGEKGLENELKEYLSNRLLDYMIPSYFIYLDKIPMSQNGKADRNSVEKLSFDFVSPEKDKLILPETRKEKAIAKVWASVLGVENVGVDDNFFHLGGDSISLMQATAMLRKVNLQFSIKTFFENPILKDLAGVIKDVSENENTHHVVVGEQVITPIQHWFFDNTKDVNFWNQLFRLKINENINISKLREAINYIVKYHDVFSLIFYYDKEIGWKSKYHSENNCVFDNYDLSKLNTESQIAQLECIGKKYQSSLNIYTGKLAAFVHFKLGDNDERLLVVINHLIIDGVSWRILIEDLGQVYEMVKNDKEIELFFKKSTPYQLWAKQLLSKNIAESSRCYWESFVQIKCENLPCEFSVGPNDYHSSQRVREVLPLKLTKDLLTGVVKKYNLHMDSILLAPLAFVLKEIFHLGKVNIDLESHGRNVENENIDLTRTIGWFTSIYPVCFELINDLALEDYMKYIDDILKSVPNNGYDYLRLRYDDDEGESFQDLGSDISFNYLGQFNNNIFNGTMFEMAEEYYGFPVSAENMRKYKLEIVMLVVDGELRMDWNYSNNQYTEKTIMRLANMYTNILEQLIQK